MPEVSYSQYSTWKRCPFAYKLRYVDGNYITSSNIHSVFGTSLHEVVQEYIRRMYEKSVTYAEEIDTTELLRVRMLENFKKEKEKMNGVNPCTKAEMLEFWDDGIQILNWLRKPKNRLRYYAKKGWSLVAIEMPIEIELKNNLKYKGLLDIVLKNKQGKHKVIDIKSSTKGWGKFAKGDATKIQQILLYKKFYAEKHNVSLENIDIEFHIMKRKLYENVEFAQPRVQRFIPAHGKVSINKAHRDFTLFVDTAFDDEGQRIKDIPYPKNPSEHNCRFCEFADPELGLCDQVKG